MLGDLTGMDKRITQRAVAFIGEFQRHRGISGRRPNARVMTKIDAGRFYALLTDRLADLP